MKLDIIKNNIKRTISIAIILVITIGGAIYCLGEGNSKKVATSIKDEGADSSLEEMATEEKFEEAPAEVEKTKAEETSAPKLEEKTQVPEEKVSKENNKDTQKVNENVKKEQPKKQNQPSKPAVEPKKPANKGTTYTSKGLGISFDLPGSWSDKYVIKDNGDKLAVFMKHSRNSEGLGLLFIITSHAEDAQFLDTIYGINKEQTINGKKLAVGGPTDYRMIENDPLEKQYREMSSQRSEVLRTLR